MKYCMDSVLLRRITRLLTESESKTVIASSWKVSKEMQDRFLFCSDEHCFRLFTIFVEVCFASSSF